MTLTISRQVRRGLLKLAEAEADDDKQALLPGEAGAKPPPGTHKPTKPTN
jgi:hypothetical protein